LFLNFDKESANLEPMLSSCVPFFFVISNMRVQF